MKPHRGVKITFGFVLIVALVWYVDLTDVAAMLASIDVKFVGVAAILILVSTLIGAINVHLLVNPESKMKFSLFIPRYWFSWAVGLIVPGQVGDVATLSMVMRRYDVDISRTLGRSLVDKVISFTLMLAFASLGIANLPGFDLAKRWPIATLPVAFLFLAYWLRARIERFLSCRYPSTSEFLHNTFMEIAAATQHYPARTSINAILTCIKICLSGASYWYIFSAFGYVELGLWQVITLAASSSIIAYLPISFNGLGTVEFVGVALFTNLGISEAAVLSGYLVLRILVMALAWFPVLLWFVLRSKNPWLSVR